ncbi:YgjV family protein [Aquisalimonas sp. 2447]|uniref:YgjV family protein n=1 Tax=Aquisalimonas sp. 2447 TaxID=2740807 RepID=UPI001C2BE2A8|nr:YgjV family protein [Aquisalimonas sp. 2447]
MMLLIAANVAFALQFLFFQSWADLPAVVAMVLGTVGMFMLRGIPMRVFLGLAALGWIASHALIGASCWQRRWC